MILCQMVQQIPCVDDFIKIKGQKGKVIQITEIDNKTYIYVQLEKKTKPKLPLPNWKRKR